MFEVVRERERQESKSEEGYPTNTRRQRLREVEREVTKHHSNPNGACAHCSLSLSLCAFNTNRRREASKQERALFALVCVIFAAQKRTRGLLHGCDMDIQRCTLWKTSRNVVNAMCSARFRHIQHGPVIACQGPHPSHLRQRPSQS